MLLSLFSLLCFAAYSISVGDWVCVNSGLNLRDKACGNVLKTSNGNERGKVLAIQNPSSCSLGTYTWYQIQLDDSGPIYWAADTGLVYECGIPSGSVVISNVPYVNQRWDTGDSFDGSWACGPTSALMAVAYHGKVASKPITTSTPWSHTNPYGWYDYSVYTSSTGVTFNREQADASGNAAWGAYGTCTDGGAAWAYRMQDYVQDHGGLTATFYDSTTTTLLKNSINAGNLVLLSTYLSSVGHIVVVVGYTPGGEFVINDPWGDANLPSWGIYPNGAYVTYSWSKLAASWCIVVSKSLDGERAPPAPRHVHTNVTQIQPKYGYWYK